MSNETEVRPFVRPGELLGFVAQLKERGLWPPRLHDRKSPGNRDKKATTPFLVIPARPGDDGSRPKPNSQVYHSQGIWLEDLLGSVVSNPVVGGQYRIKCRVQNLGAFPAYGGLADFFVNRPGVFTAAAGTSTTLPSLGHTGFSLLPPLETVLTCPNLWIPASPAELASSILVHVYDPFADALVSRFDAHNDRHVGRHDLTPDLYVRDWTDSAAVHDHGEEPSARSVFYRTSDVWNRRSVAPGGFVNDQPQNQDPQAGNGAAGDNFIFARISRESALVQQEVRAHFLFAEFGTGSPYINCSPAPDPSVILAPGETTKLISLPWHLHPSSSAHLCIAVQIYSDEDPYAPPGLLGYTPGWPTTDLMVINDNNKAQRNIEVWNGVPESEGTHFGIVFNAATFVRDMVLRIGASDGAMQRLRKPTLRVPLSGVVRDFAPGDTLVLERMLPGERRWVAFSYDGFSAVGESLSVSFDEIVDNTVVNGFSFELRAAPAAKLIPATVAYQESVFRRMAEGMDIEAGKAGLEVVRRLKGARVDSKTYLGVLPAISNAMTQSLLQMFSAFGSVKDPFGVVQAWARFRGSRFRDLAPALARHNALLQQVDALQTMAVKSRGDVADILFTVRLQRDVYAREKLSGSGQFDELLKRSDDFIREFSGKRDKTGDYLPLLQTLVGSFESTVGLLGNGVVGARFQELTQSLSGTVESAQLAHRNFLNAVLVTLQPD